MAKIWRVGSTQDITENDSDKTFTVPSNTEWEILWVKVQYTSSSVVGNRQLEIQIQSSGSVIAQWQTGLTQEKELTYNYLFGVGIPDLNTPRDTNYLMTPLIGSCFLSAGQQMRVWDNNSIDPSGDDMLAYVEYGYSTT